MSPRQSVAENFRHMPGGEPQTGIGHSVQMTNGARRVPSVQRLQDRSHHHALPQRMSDTCWGKRAVAAAAITRRRQRRMPHLVSVAAKRARAEESSLPGRPDGRLRGARPPSDVYVGHGRQATSTPPWSALAWNRERLTFQL
ncbi:hypothetical protein CH63R_03027 [Colletotrichum higginsianum IMI 349063]|uniref:Uncharacterized protein n=1 Tax=Colletotrichum higginsianum (strain IMI 349063) TaxID=759273 RepID=A0A1B7YQI3_COLHI|nr:hypothetical protein CH63R_03027 [Colletotrichum higginsianum IMI 349063]OBR14301.1 hypothetical protein CH63R_03027 [Colletotrichum higginsianum IMI 349063]